MKDTVKYSIDFLPQFVELDFPNGKKGVFRLKIDFGGPKGWSVGYWLDDDYCEPIQEADWEVVCDFMETFDGAHPNALFGADYIRSDADFRAVVRNCYRFLRKHGLCKVRQHNIRAKQKLFTSPVY